MNKILLSLFTACFSFICLSGQEEAGKNREPLKVIYINKGVSTHIISPEPVSYVDLSIPDIAGDLPQANTIRVKPTKDGVSGVITIIGERSMTQYLLVYSNDLSKVYSRYSIPYSDVRSYVNPESSMTRSQMYDYGYNMLISKNKFYNVSTKKWGLKTTLNNIYTMDKYFFIDISILNKTNIQYDIDHITWRIEDKKKSKATNFQSIEVSPVMELLKDKSFKKDYRNVFVFEKFTFPEEKVLVLEIDEKQTSGRVIRLEIEYTDILNADSFINR